MENNVEWVKIDWQDKQDPAELRDVQIPYFTGTVPWDERAFCPFAGGSGDE